MPSSLARETVPSRLETKASPSIESTYPLVASGSARKDAWLAISSAHAFDRQMLERFCMHSWSNWTRSDAIELTTSHAVMSSRIWRRHDSEAGEAAAGEAPSAVPFAAAPSAVPFSAAPSIRFSAAPSAVPFSAACTPFSAPSSICAATPAATLCPAFASCRAISSATSGMTSTVTVCPSPMPRMRYAPCARSRKVMSLPRESAARALSACLMSMPVVRGGESSG